MNRLRKEIRIIPIGAWVTAFAVYLCGMTVLTTVVLRHSPELRNMHFGLQILFSKVLPVILFVYTLLIGYIYADAKRRGMRYVLWTLLSIFIPQAIGIILYFIFREPLPVECSGCRGSVQPGFAFCPFCGKSLALACPQCKRAVEPSWSSCAFCGNQLPRAASSAAG